MDIKIRRLNKDIPLPKYDPAHAAAFDIAAAKNVVIKPGEIKHISTGLFIEVPPGYFLGIFSRSSTPLRTGLTFPHGVGVVDPLYSGPSDEILIQVYNFSNKEVEVKIGERIAQGIFIQAPKIKWQEVDAISQQDRGGFGSTGH